MCLHSDCPEIYSNGYQICFNAHDGPIGYILPHWIEKARAETVDASHWTTRIYLPMKSETEREKHRSRSFVESFHDIQSSLLIFLNRLRSITIDNRLNQSKQVYQRRDIAGTSLVEIHQPSSSVDREQWFVMKKCISIVERIRIDCNEHVDSTEIALAFPLHDIKTHGSTLLSKRDVFAYLPLRTVGQILSMIFIKYLSFSFSSALHLLFKLISKLVT
jgi:hypothetical protein